MTKQVQRRRGTATQHTSFTGAEGEISVNTTNKSVHVHDGTTAGGIEAARADMTNVTDANLNARLNGNTLSSLTITSADINGGTIDGTVIGGTTPAAITGTTLTATSSATLQHSASTKLATTSTGIDVTGTVTADGLTVDGGSTSTIRITGSGQDSTEFSILEFFNSDGSLDGPQVTGKISMTGNASGVNSSLNFYTALSSTGVEGAAPTKRMTIDNNGDISFYEDTGTTPKFFWDASAEALTIGTTTTVSNNRLVIEQASGDGANSGFYLQRNGAAGQSFKIDIDSSDVVNFRRSTVQAMAIDSSGRVGIGTSSPSAPLDVVSSGTTSETIAEFGNANISNGLTIQTNGNLDWGFNATNSRNLTLSTNQTERMRIDSSGRVGVGTTSPEFAFHLNGTNTTLLISEDSEGSATLQFGDTQGSTSQSFAISYDTGGTNDTLFKRNNSKVGMWTNEGFVVGVGANATSPYAIFTANNDSTKAGVGLRDTGYLAVGRYNEQCAYFNRMNSDGTIADFRKDGTVVGAIGNNSSSTGLTIYSTVGAGIAFYVNGIAPTTGAGAYIDNSKDIGSSSVRWDDVYATNGTIQTSDRNEKQDIAELDEAEKRVAVAAKGLIRKYRWKDAVAEKGDDARIHVGIIAQDLQAAFAAEGLDAGRYAMFISSTWWEADEVIPAVDEVLDDEGNVVTEAQPERTVTHHYETVEEAPEGATERTRLGVRYPELLAFIIGAL